jgi:protein gp37
MSDLFHELVPFEFVDRVFAVMALAPRHTFQILTKRPERMAEYFKRLDTRALEIGGAMADIQPSVTTAMLGNIQPPSLPLPNAWLGTSVEDQRVTSRVEYLRRIPGAVRFLSCEPLIGPLDLDLEGIHWVIVGGESGHGHRPIDMQWVRDIRAQAEAASAAFFFKQWGGIKPKAGGRELDGRTYDEMPQVVSGHLTSVASDALPTAL